MHPLLTFHDKLFSDRLRCQTLRVPIPNLRESSAPSTDHPQTPGSPRLHVATSTYSEQVSDEDRQDKAWKIQGHATTDPSFVDPETGDSIWHALSLLPLESDDLLWKLHHYVSANVDLNRPNNSGEYPILAFIRGRPIRKPEDDETGAQKSKYLETLMWKDPKAHGRTPNLVNINIRVNAGASALYHAAIRGQCDMVRSLIDRGVNVNARLGTVHLADLVSFASNRDSRNSC